MDTVLTIFAGTPGAVFEPTKPFLISAERVTLDFYFTIAAAPATLEWYMEFTSDNPNVATARWAREVAEDNAGAGVVNMPLRVRNFAGIIDAEKRDCQFVRAHRFCRAQLRLAAASPPIAQLVVVVPYGLPAQSPTA